ncbi:hypothetical protein KSC_022190 [Ktedonobacter sp. SOSP1-52]|uniref:YncE family protein n=1 Tax=Ktedonobacter sp. SOSP1-52 TaxID=2778366 RepID=UPI0019158B4D|nr:YncE family protein [Ktedonobacter sp. SOSP1-52]GHO63327.1 hypothetical protein KSC_022190 [Ktedonobacter sp. SOSP1-52]
MTSHNILPLHKPNRGSWRPGRVLIGVIGLIVLLLTLGLVGWYVLAPQRAADLAGRLQTLTDIPLSGGASRFDYQTLDPKTGLLFISHPGASRVSVFKVPSNTWVTDIPALAGVHGVLAIPALGRVYASVTDDNQVAVIDEQTLRVITRIPGGDYPDGMAYDPIQQRLFVSDEAGQTETVIDTRTEQRIATIPLGGEAGNTQYDASTQRIFVAVQTLNQLIAIYPTTEQVVAQYTLPGCQHSHSLLLDEAARLAFVTCDGNNVLLVLDMLHHMQVLSMQAVGETPDVLAFEQDRRLLYVACESGVLSLFQEQGRGVHKWGDQFIAPEAHSIAVDQHTHRLYFPLEDLGGRPVLRVALFTQR